MDRKTTLNLHIASQYLSAAGKNYVNPKEDDSHTNLAWDENSASFISRRFSNGDVLIFNTLQMSLMWKGDNRESIELKGQNHADVLEWLRDISQKNGLTPYKFDLHYSLDSGEIKSDYRFDGIQEDSLTTHAEYRTFTDRACHAIISEMGFDAQVRTWPHHFDTGTYVILPDTDLGIGFGLSIPGVVSKEYYLYTAGYKGHDAQPTAAFPVLTKGHWVSGQWEGGILQTIGLRESDYHSFFRESITAIRSTL